MFTNVNKINAYVAVDNNLEGPAFEKRWFESVVMILKKIQRNELNEVESHIKLLEVCQGIQWVQENLNEKLNSQHRTMLKAIYSTNIQILNGIIQTKNMEYLPLVITSLEVVLKPYEKIN
ncbi:hypothetical protein [Polynucleobacter sp. UB-Raua-W9]|jgi:hypothetical protein|uniref:hypothetical protein n=1 Tax=Polynucleobacter sp. UB-Raua-W9 TaxID=1819736 RepID=UPI001BFD3599|nr:hypothetical protein [Polynucleobacter sp. UB-Raua-W9]QWD71791.1 hypothetical protein AOC07_05895 [Polynucleobacter sp. UB-Raua-W9]